MSDGNFNRALLPKNDFAAGLKMGQGRMRAKAELALREILAELDLDEEIKRIITQQFMNKIKSL